MKVWEAATLLAAALAGMAVLSVGLAKKKSKLAIAGIVCLGLAALGFIGYLALTLLLINGIS